ncbi:hypothetical protein J6590_048546 [Homalodisca vitripennis]|nr:hypothetical protein J6590_048546 [Homalodisca vitripennis]
MAGHETQDNDGLPRCMPLAEIDGRELRITLEWWEMDKTIDKMIRVRVQDVRRELQDRRQSETRGGEKQLIWCGVTVRSPRRHEPLPYDCCVNGE